jgi:large subunit ribosomal protein L9
MEVILLSDIDKVGLRGEVVNVSRGYMRNFLQPRRLAELATPERVAELEKREAIRARHEAKSFEQAQEMAETLGKTVLRFEVKAGPRGRLFGAVTPTDITDELWRARKIRVDRRKIDLSDPIKRVGRYQVPIELFQDVDVEVKLLVVPEGGELPPEEEIAAWEAEEAVERAAAEAAAAEEHAAAEEAVEEIVAEETAPEETAAEEEAAEKPTGDEAYGEQAVAAGVGESEAVAPRPGEGESAPPPDEAAESASADEERAAT